MKRGINAIKLVTVGLLLSAISFGQSSQLLTLESYLSANGVQAGEEFMAALVVDIREPWHINSNQPLDEFTIPTEVRLDESSDYSVLELRFPQHIERTLSYSDEPMALFSGEMVIFIRGIAASDLRDDFHLQGSFYYQGCDDVMCLAPQETPFRLEIPLLDSDEPVISANIEIFGSMAGEPEAATPADDSGTFDVQQSLSQKGILLTFILIFLGGLALNLAPCVYPLIPITISYFGGQAAGQEGRRIVMALLYVLGIAIVNSMLGTLAALSGGLLGTAMTNPVVLLVIAAILVLLSLSMFGVYEFRLPNFLMNMGGGGRSGYMGSLVMGLTMGIVAAPCIGPFVIGLLTYVASIGNAFLGFAMFFTLSLGLGLPYLFLAFFSSQLGHLPKAGDWMVGVRLIFGFVLIGMAFYFLQPLIPDPIYRIAFPAFIILSGVYLILFNRSGDSSTVFLFIKRILALAAVIAGVWMLKPSAPPAEDIQWEAYSTVRFEEALQEGKPMILDFYADWCIPCKEMDELTFTDPELVALSRQFALFKIDLTRNPSDEYLEIKEKMKVMGVPTILFLDPVGEEIRDARVLGFENAEQFMAKMKTALDR